MFLKSYCLVKRRADIPKDDFRAAWDDIETQVVPLVAGREGLVRVAAYDVVVPRPDHAVVDAVMVAWCLTTDDAEAFQRTVLSEDATALIHDAELTTLIAEERVVRGHEHLRANWETGRTFGPYVGFVWAASLLPGWSRYLHEKHAPLMNDVVPEELRGAAYIQNHAVRSPTLPPAPIDNISEVWSDDLGFLLEQGRWIQSCAQVKEDEAAFIGPETQVFAVIGRETIRCSRSHGTVSDGARR